MDDARRAVRPLERVVMFLGGLILLGLVIQVGVFLTGHDSFFGLGAPDVCVSAPQSVLSGPGNITNVHMPSLGPGARATTQDVVLCQSHPTSRERSWSEIDQDSGILFIWGLLFWLWRLLRGARRNGVFVESFARGLGGLGVYVLLGALGVSVAHAFARWQLIQAIAPGAPHSFFFMYSFTALLVGLGLITLGRVMAHTVPMREELDATV